MILVWDPGPARTGFIMASYLPDERKINIEMMKIIPGEEVYTYLGLVEKLLAPGEKHTFIVENFRVDEKIRGRVFQWDEMETSQMIGTLKYAAYRMNNSPVFIQEPATALSNAKRWAPWPWLKRYDRHLDDDKAAYCHLFVWANKRRMINTTDDILMKGQEKLW